MVPNFHKQLTPDANQNRNTYLRKNRILNWLGVELSSALTYALSVSLVFGNLALLFAKTSALPVQSIRLSAELTSPTQLRLSWSITNPGSISSVRVYRANAENPQNFEMAASLASNVRSYVDQGLISGRTYFYQIKTVAAGGVLLSSPSNTLSVTMPNAMGGPTPTPTATPRPTATPTPIPTPTPPPTPTPTPNPVGTPPPGNQVLSARAISQTQIELFWQIPTTQRITSVRIYRTTAAAAHGFEFITAVGVLPGRFVDSGLSPNTTYLYQIKWPVSGVLLSPPSNTVRATTLGGSPTPTPTPVATPTPTPTPTPVPTPSPTPTPTPVPTPTPSPTPNPIAPSGPIPLDEEEKELVRLISEYRGTRSLGRVRPSIALTKSSDFLSRDLAARNIVSKFDSSGRNIEQRARAFGYQPNTTFDGVVAAGNLTAQQALNTWKLSSADNDVLLTPAWKVAGVGRTYNASTGRWHWVVEFAGFWDKTIPLPGEDEDGRIDGNEWIRTRPPGAAIAAGHRFSGYGDDGEWYSALHCDLDAPGGLRDRCWKDEPPQGNPSLLLPSSPDNLVGTWHVQYSISPTGVVHYNDYSGWDATGFTITYWINANGTWTSKGYRAYQVPTPTESGTWTSVHDASRDEEIVTFHRPGKPSATIRIHAARGVLTMFAVEGGSAMQGFLKGVPADNNPADDPQIILHPGVGYFNAPHGPFQ